MKHTCMCQHTHISLTYSSDGGDDGGGGGVGGEVVVVVEMDRIAFV